jgi:uncharacterized protein
MANSKQLNLTFLCTLTLSLLLFIAVPLVSASQPAHLTLLAVSETENGTFEGNTADLYLEIRPGTGHIYVDTFPLTKVDTQMSIRLANRIACDFLDTACDRYDFFYTVRSDSAIVGGPSAGAATAALTAAALEGISLDQKAAVTGTINPGGLVGPVGGLKEKIEAAAEANLTRVFIPKGERFTDTVTGSCTENCTNSTEDRNPLVSISQTTDLAEYAREKNITLNEAATLDDVMFGFTGKRYNAVNQSFAINNDYNRTMSDIAAGLCERAAGLRVKLESNKQANSDKSGAKKQGNSTSANISKEALAELIAYEQGINLSERGNSAISDRAYYSAASFCFGANIRLNSIIIKNRHLTKDALASEIIKAEKNVSEFAAALDRRQLNTITDLQTYSIVRERLIEAEDRLKDSLAALSHNNTNTAADELAYGIERYNSAVAWSAFFGLKGEAFDLNRDALRQSCMQKLSEAEESYQYADLFLPGMLNDTKKQLLMAYEDQKNNNYSMCLMHAGLSKAEADVVLSMVNMDSRMVGDYLEEELRLIQQNIARQQARGVFPILGYSYYEYAESLKESDRSSALIYAGYAMEMSNVGIYFSPVEETSIGSSTIGGVFYYYSQNYGNILKMAMLFVLGCIAGILITQVYRRRAVRLPAKMKIARLKKRK